MNNLLTILSTLYTQSQLPENDPETPPIPYLHQPALSPDGSKIAFCYAGDIWIVSATGGEARRITSHPSYDSHPIFSPDGTALAFASQRTGGGNIYVISLKSGSTPRRLTYHNMSAPPSAWSPDGQWIYFTSRYNGLGGEIFKIHIDGGTPIRTAGDSLETHYNITISPDGKTLAFNNNGHPWWRHGRNPAGHSDIWIMDEAIGAGGHRRLTRYLGRNLKPMWDSDGAGLYYLCDRDGEENIWYMPLMGDNDAIPITHFTDGRVLRPAISADGKSIGFERDFQLWRLNVETREAQPLKISVQTDEKTNPIHHHTYNGNIDEFRLSPDGKKVAFIVHGEVFADLADKGDKVKRGGDSFKVTDTPARESELRWNPDSDRIVYTSDRTGHNELFQYDFKQRVETQLTDSADEKHSPQFSSDSKWLAYITKDSEIWLMETETQETRAFITGQLFVGVFSPTDFVWSPDSKWLAFIATDENFFSNIYVQHIDEETPKQLTFLSNINTFDLHWAANGKFIVFNTGQYRGEYQIARVDLMPVQPTFKEEDFDKLFEEKKDEKKDDEEEEKDKESPQSPEAESQDTSEPSSSNDSGDEKSDDESENGSDEKKSKDKSKKKKKIEPVEIEFDTIKQRLRFLTDFKLNAQAVGIRPNCKTLIYQVAMTRQSNLWSMSLEEDKRGEAPKQLTSSAGQKSDLHFLPDGKKFYYLDGGRIHQLGMGEDGGKEGDPKALETRAEVEVNFHIEKMQAFNEAWRIIRGHFYDPQFHGCDWDEVRNRFRPVVEGIYTKTDFHEILNLMVGELNASHLGAGGGRPGAPDSFLGVDFEREALERNGHFKITGLLPQSPLALAKEPAQVGEYLVAIDDTELNGGVNLAEQLQRKAGRRVRVKLNDKPQPDGARELIIQPVDGGRHYGLRYKNWVYRNADYVHEKSDQRLGYVHIREMSYPAYLQFIADLDAEAHNKAGVVIDVRFNGGGHIAPFILDVLSRRAYTLSSYRGHVTTSDTNLAGSRILEKPIILITNEHSGSNTEMFSEGFRQLGLGKVVGMPTAGAVIWTWGWRLMDGTSFRLPRFQVSTLSGENIEGAARPVDIEVDRPLGEAERGIDSQLDVAIEQLLMQLEG
jgi:tricorn protease